MIVSEYVYIKFKNKISRMSGRKTKIFTKDGKHGVIVKDGRPVNKRKVKGKYVWVYEMK